MLSLIVGADTPTHFGLTNDDWLAAATVALAVATLLLVLFTAVSVWLAGRSERRRTQPIVIVHGMGSTRFADDGREGGELALDAWLSNEGGGPAFNVRFGVEYDGVRFAWRFDQEDPETGSRQRVIRSGDRLPEEGKAFVIPIPWAKAQAGSGKAADDGRIYWCRYENAYGQMWETRNPWKRWEDLDIRRVRFVRLCEWREVRKLRTNAETFKKNLTADIQALLGTIEQTDDENPPQPEDGSAHD